MGPAHKKNLFRPATVAVIGASERPGQLGSAVMANLLAGSFRGPVLPVNRRYDAVQRVLCYRNLDALPLTPDLALVCTGPDELERVIGSLAARGTSLAVLMTNQLEHDDPLCERLRRVSREHGMRLLGPGSTGLQVPGIGLNASWIASSADSGSIALLCESGSLASGIIEQAAVRGVGFSHVITTGGGCDLNIPELLDMLILDSRVRAILLQVRSIGDARHFLSAARAAARIKPVIVLDSGQPEPCGDGVPYSSADIHDSLFRRAGMLPVQSSGELFDAVETLAHSQLPRGERIALLGNGEGLLELAQQTLKQSGVSPIKLSPELCEQLQALCDTTQHQPNPINLGRGATPQTYREAIRLLLGSDQLDAALVLHCATPVAESTEVAEAVALAGKGSRKNILACWMGNAAQQQVRERLGQSDIPVYDAPEKCARAFLHLIHHRRNQQTLLQMPGRAPVIETRQVDRDAIGEQIEQARNEDRLLLDESHSARILATYGIRTPESRVVQDTGQAVAAGQEIGWPVALRLSSAQLRQTMSVGNMILDLSNQAAVTDAAEKIQRRFLRQYPGKAFPGLVVQQMVRRPQALVLGAGLYHHPRFGALIGLGPGGIQHHLRRGHALALPPLNMNLAEELVNRTHLREILPVDLGDRGRVDQHAIQGLLVQLSRLCSEQPGIQGIEINPLLADEQGVIALDARISLMPREQKRLLAIRPYPRELQKLMKLGNGQTVLLRPIRPEDEQLYRQLLEQVTPDDLRMRFCGELGQLPRAVLAQQIHLDYDREMTLLAIQEGPDGSHCLGTVNAITRGDNSEAEYAILVRSDLKGTGLGRLLMEQIIDYCRQQNTGSIFGLVLRENRPMRGLARRLGFHESDHLDEDLVEVRLALNPSEAEAEPIQLEEIFYP